MARRLSAPISVALCAVGAAIFAAFTPVVNNLPFAWHPLALPFLDGVSTNGAGVRLSLELGALLLAYLGEALVLVRLQPCWGAAVLLYGTVGAAGVGQFLPPWCHGLGLGLAALPLALGVAAARSQGRQLQVRLLAATAGLLMATTALLEVSFVGLQLGAYGLMVAGVTPAAAAAGLAGLGLAAAQAASGRSWLLPAALLTTLALTGLVYSPAVSAHHDGPAPAGTCQALDVQQVQPLGRRHGRPAWVTLEGPRGVYVAGVDFLMHLTDRGVLQDQVELPGVERIQDLALQGEGVLAAGSPAVVRWIPGRSPERLLHIDDLGGRPLAEFGFVAAAGRSVWVAGLLYPLLVELPGGMTAAPPPPRVHYLGELQSRVFVGVGRTSRGLFAWDAAGIGELDPERGVLTRFRRYGPLSLAVAVHFGHRHLFRARAYTRGIDVVDGGTLEVVRAIDTPYSPRFLAASTDDALLASSDMMGEHAYLYSLRTGAMVARYRVGPRPRGLAYSRRRGRFMGVSACGWYMLPPAPR